MIAAHWAFLWMMWTAARVYLSSTQLCMMLHLWLRQEANLQRVKKGDSKASIHRMEIDRIRFVLSSYLRSRLQKVSGVSITAHKAALLSVARWQSRLLSLCLDREVFPARPGEGKVSTGRRSVAAFTPGVCLCQRVSRIKSGLFVSRHCCDT